MNLRRILIGPAVALIALAISMSAAVARDHNTRAGEFIESLANQATTVLGRKDMSLEEREEHLRNLLDAGFALDKIGRFVIGRAWRQMSQDQRQDYLELYGEWVLKTYSSQLGGFSGQTFSIVKIVKSGDKDVFVRSRINQPGGGPSINCDWRVREIEGELKVVDVVIEGISMLVTQRSEFATVVQKHGVEGLIETLRARVSKYPALSG